ncbi:Phenylacetic acid catabolic protein [Peribacillus cavernae]|nr:Phenylacetic acid catabolic protein [Peribacillus cavernae]MDQ0218096.1 phenylacetate-CoA oxygenase PaaI subunit [Peribacillus cavernae]
MIQANQLAKELLYMADDEWVIGSFLAEMSGGGPFVEENVAISSIAQDEIGHAEIIYNEILDLDSAFQWESADGFVHQRPVSGFKVSALVSAKTIDWAAIIVQHYFYEAADQYRVSQLIEVVEGRTKNVLGQMAREERYHHRHWHTWLSKMSATLEGKRRIQEEIYHYWPKLAGFFHGTFLADDQTTFQSVKKELTTLGFATPEIKEGFSGRGVLSDDVKLLITRSRVLVEGMSGGKW